MELALLVYAVSLLEEIKGFLFVLVVLFIVIAIIAGITCLDTPGTVPVAAKRWLKGSILAAVAAHLLGVFIPSERTAYIMVAAYATQKIAQAPEVRETGDRVLTLINSRLDQLILEAQPAQKKGK